MIVCKICNKSFVSNNYRQKICSETCVNLNKKILKKQYYLKNKDLCLLRSKNQRLSGYSWVPTIEQKEKYKEKNKKWRRIYKNKNPEKIKNKNYKFNNSINRKNYMKNYALDEKNKERLRDNEKKYRLKPTTKEIRYTDHYKRKYNITAQDYDIMEMSQMGLCKICKKPESKKFNGKIIRLAVDHCHKTGTVRGLLCWRCNTTLGKLEDSLELVYSFIDYIKENTK